MPFFAAFLAPVVLIIVLNCVAFVLVSYQLLGISGANIKKTSGISNIPVRLRRVISVMILLGLTWMFAFVTFNDRGGEAMQYIFTILNSLQGFFIFVFYCLINTEAQKAWKNVLPCFKVKGKHKRFSNKSSEQRTGSNTRPSSFLSDISFQSKPPRSQTQVNMFEKSQKNKNDLSNRLDHKQEQVSETANALRNILEDSSNSGIHISRTSRNESKPAVTNNINTDMGESTNTKSSGKGLVEGGDELSVIAKATSELSISGKSRQSTSNGDPIIEHDIPTVTKDSNVTLDTRKFHEKKRKTNKRSEQRQSAYMSPYAYPYDRGLISSSRPRNLSNTTSDVGFYRNSGFDGWERDIVWPDGNIANYANDQFWHDRIANPGSALYETGNNDPSVRFPNPRRDSRRNLSVSTMGINTHHTHSYRNEINVGNMRHLPVRTNQIHRSSSSMRAFDNASNRTASHASRVTTALRNTGSNYTEIPYSISGNTKRKSAKRHHNEGPNLK